MLIFRQMGSQWLCSIVSFYYFVGTNHCKMKPLYFILAIALTAGCKKELDKTRPSFTYTYTDSLNNSHTISAISTEISAGGYFSPAQWQQKTIYDNDTTFEIGTYPSPQLFYDSNRKCYNFYFVDFNIRRPAFALSLPALNNTNTGVDTTGTYRVFFYAIKVEFLKSIVSTNVVRAGLLYNGTFFVAWDNGAKLTGS